MPQPKDPLPSPFTQDQVSNLLSPLVTQCFEEPFSHKIQEEAEYYVAHRFLTRTKHHTETIDSGYDVSEHVRGTRRPYQLDDYETIQDFLSEPYATEPTFESGSGFRARTHQDDLEFDAFYPAVNELMLEAFERIAADDTQEGSNLHSLATHILQHVGQSDYGWGGADVELAEQIAEAIAENFYTDTSIAWVEAFLAQPLAPAVHKHAERIRLEQEEEAAQRRMEAIRLEQLNARALVLLDKLGPAAQDRYEVKNYAAAWKLIQRAFELGATHEDAHTLVSHLNLSNNLTQRLNARIKEHQ